MAKDYVRTDTATLRYVSGGKTRKIELLWGDQVEVVSASGGKTTVKARGRTGTVDTSALGGEALCEVYFIDVGQGDGVLICTPDRRHILIDGGYIRERQATGKNAADFVDWKFAKDYRKTRIKLDAMIASHCDSDHYGGLWDLLSTTPEATAELDAKGVDVDVLYHAGVSWWRKPGGGRWLGPIRKIGGTKFLVQLLGNRTAVKDALDPSKPGPKLQGEWANFMTAAIANGCDIRRLSHHDGWVPGFEPRSGKPRATLKILAPVEFDDGAGGPAYRAYTSSTSQNTNGHSLLLRLDYKNTRILLTGDLNKRSMAALLEDVDSRLDLACDVAKGCHHGSEDVSYTFLQAMGAAATVISSGDNEGHSHPRPSIVATAGQVGHVTIANDEMKTPLVYSTEISRSIDIGRLTSIQDADYPGTAPAGVTLTPAEKATLRYEVQRSGDLNPEKVSRSYHRGTRVVDSVTYGLVNVRTDGKKILCATLNEKKDKWELETFQSRF